MINLSSLKKKQAANIEAGETHKKPAAAVIRVQRDLADLELPPTIKMDFPNPDDILNFNLKITPDEGIYQNGCFEFTVTIKDYPHDPPKVLCTQKIYHPNIDLDGNICLNVLREDWKPVLNLNTVLVGLLFLFLEPNPDDPLNKEAAQSLRSDKTKFMREVSRSLSGGSVGGQYYDDVRATSTSKMRR